MMRSVLLWKMQNLLILLDINLHSLQLSNEGRGRVSFGVDMADNCQETKTIKEKRMGSYLTTVDHAEGKRKPQRHKGHKEKL
jgi:hypothetical protein